MTDTYRDGLNTNSILEIVGGTINITEGIYGITTCNNVTISEDAAENIHDTMLYGVTLFKSNYDMSQNFGLTVKEFGTLNISSTSFGACARIGTNSSYSGYVSIMDNGKSISKGAALTVPERRTVYVLEVNGVLTNNGVLTVNGIAKFPEGTALKNLGYFIVKGSILVGDTKFYAVDFDSQGGNAIERQYVVFGERAEEPALPPPAQVMCLGKFLEMWSTWKRKIRNRAFVLP